MQDIIDEIINKESNIKYGWVDRYNVIHTHSKLQFFYDNYRYMGVEDTLKYKVGTCFEKANLCRYYLEEQGIESNVYMIDYDCPEKLAKHTFCVVYNKELFYLVEASWVVSDNHPFKTLDELFESIIRKYPKMYKIEGMDRKLIHIYSVPKIDNYVSFYEYLDIVHEHPIN